MLTVLAKLLRSCQIRSSISAPLIPPTHTSLLWRRPFEVPTQTPFQLRDLDCEVRVLTRLGSEATTNLAPFIHVDTNVLDEAFLAQALENVVAVNQVMVAEGERLHMSMCAHGLSDHKLAHTPMMAQHPLPHTLLHLQSFVLRVPATLKGGDQPQGSDNLQLAVRVTCVNTLSEEEQASQLAGYHCYRGMVTADTKLFFNVLSSKKGKFASHG